MGRPANALTIVAATYVGLVLIKDGTAGTLIGNAATFLRTAVKGITPLTRVG